MRPSLNSSDSVKYLRPAAKVRLKPDASCKADTEAETARLLGTPSTPLISDRDRWRSFPALPCQADGADASRHKPRAWHVTWHRTSRGTGTHGKSFGCSGKLDGFASAISVRGQCGYDQDSSFIALLRVSAKCPLFVQLRTSRKSVSVHFSCSQLLGSREEQSHHPP
jgi:hypothetical protein